MRQMLNSMYSQLVNPADFVIIVEDVVPPGVRRRRVRPLPGRAFVCARRSGPGTREPVLGRTGLQLQPLHLCPHSVGQVLRGDNGFYWLFVVNVIVFGKTVNS